MATIDELVIEIKGDLGDISKKLKRLEKQTGETQQKVGKNFNNIARVAKVALGAVVVQQLARAGARLVRFGSAVEEMQAKSSVVFGQFAGDVRKELSEFGNAVGRSVFELEGMASSIQDTFVPLGFARGEAADLSVQLTKLATDVASFNNASDAETMQRFQSALVGNHETVRRFGIVITEATLQQELLRMGINKTSKEATNAEKVQARLNLLMAGTADAQGDAARTATSFANQMKGLGGELENLGIAIITPLMPTLASFIGFLKESVRGLRDTLFSIGLLKHDIKTTAGLTEQLNMMTEKLRDKENQRQKRRGHSEQVAKLKLEIQLLKEQQGEIDRMLEKGKKFAIQQEIEARLATQKATAVQSLNNAIDEQTKKNELLTKLSKLNTDAEREALMQTTEFASQLALLGNEGTELEEKLYNLILANEKLGESIKDTGDDVKEMTPLMSALMDATVSVGHTFENTFIATLSGTRSALEGFRDMSKQLVEEILRIYVRMSVINPIIRSIFKGQQGFTKDFADTNFPTADGSAVFSNALNLGKRAIGMGKAGGGSVSGRQPVMVGERGPEMFIPNVGGRIVPNGSLSSGRGSTIINQSLNFTTGIQNTVRAEVMNMMPLIQNATLEAVVDQKRRGGAFAQSLT